MSRPLEALGRIRLREVDRAARGAAAAQGAFDAAEDGRRAAAARLDAAHAAHARAGVLRLDAPADEHVRTYLSACEARMVEAERGLNDACRTAAAAQHALHEARRRWLRAQVRRDTMNDLIDQERRADARDRERRLADEAQDRAAAGGMA